MSYSALIVWVHLNYNNKNNNKKKTTKKKQKKQTNFQTVPDNLSETHEDMCDIWEGFKINTVETVRQ